ncbi:MAG: transposase [Thermoleophilia bacterium]|nr:transposase [Thermoleophilia bacterium]
MIRREAGLLPAGYGKGRSGHLVSDWVELFAPLVAGLPSSVRAPSYLILDSLPFRLRRARSGMGASGLAFTIYAALGQEPDGSKRLLALEAFPGIATSQGLSHWQSFLSSLQGRLSGDPLSIVSDRETPLLKALSQIWPSAKTGDLLQAISSGNPQASRGGGQAAPGPILWYCHHHLKGSIRNLLTKAGIQLPDPLLADLEQAFSTSADWTAYKAQMRARRPYKRFRKATGWLSRQERIIDWQVQNQRFYPASVGALEAYLARLRSHFDDRRGRLLNRERTNRLLLLMLMEENGEADERAYAKAIRQELLQNGGRARPSRQIEDRHGPSLR